MKWWAAYLLVAAGGALGAMARMAVATGSRALFGENFPWGTFVINISGSFILGFVATLIVSKAFPDPDLIRYGVAIGFLGAYTTFSTFELEADALMINGRWISSLVYIISSVVAGFIAVRLGIAAAK